MLVRMLKISLVSAALLGAAAYAWALAAPKEEPHSDPFRSCVSAECHTEITQHKYLHGPLVIGQCTVCHAPLPGPEHKFRVQENDAILCSGCHRSVDAEKFLHDPVAEGKCLKCHDPHGSESPAQIRLSPVVKLCRDCHDPVSTKKDVHEPVSKGECLDCHRAHGSKEQKLLTASGRNLCFQCHEELKPGSAGRGKIHLAEEDCSGCHLPHESDLVKLLAKPPLELCFQCHDDLKNRLAEDRFGHEAVTEGLACIECHNAHISKYDSLLKERSGDLCFSCHEEMKSRIEAAAYKHQPVADKACSSCHLSHSSKYSNRLIAETPEGSYEPYDPSKYALCFTCHEEALTGERYTETYTDFRNGNLNLHYLHVNRKTNGRTCHACHEEHAGSQPKLIRTEASYGSWKITILFSKTDTGGNCTTGCHEEHGYDRISPVPLKAQ
jgi:predicted CXXCH cytochrome family protein